MTNIKLKAFATERSKAAAYELPIIPMNENLLVDARLLHSKLKIKEKFTDWAKRRIEEYGFRENVDYFRNFGKTSMFGGRPSKEILFTIDTAKEICMVERSETGRAFRHYFIEAEKELRTKRLYAQTATITDISKRIKPISINGRKLYLLRPVQEALGFSTRCSTANIRRCNSGLLAIVEGRAYVAEEYVRLMIINATAKAIRSEVKQAKPVLPANFGQLPLNFTKGGSRA